MINDTDVAIEDLKSSWLTVLANAPERRQLAAAVDVEDGERLNPCHSVDSYSRRMDEALTKSSRTEPFTLN